MKKNLLIVSLSLGLAFTACQTDNVSEEIQLKDSSLATVENCEVSASKIHEPTFLDGPGAAIHEPTWLEGPTTNIHEPPLVSEMSWFDCGDDYTGGPNLNINKNNPSSYSSAETGVITLKNLNVGGDLRLCGNYSVANTVNIHRAGEFEFVGEMMIGTKEEPADLVINSGAHLDFAGKIIVTGDLIINKGATVRMFAGHDGFPFTVGGESNISASAFVEDHRDHEHQH